MTTNNNPTTRRPIEREYLATLNAAVPLDTWQNICNRAAEDALAGDARARDWLSKWLLGDSRILTTLAAEESQATPDAVAACEIESCRRRLSDERRAEEQYSSIMSSLYPVDYISN